MIRIRGGLEGAAPAGLSGLAWQEEEEKLEQAACTASPGDIGDMVPCSLCSSFIVMIETRSHIRAISYL